MGQSTDLAKACSRNSTMAPGPDVHAVIGATAGKVWQFLEKNGPASPASIGKGIGGSAPEVHRAVGWLSREGKLMVVKTPRGERISLAKES